VFVDDIVARLDALVARMRADRLDSDRWLSCYARARANDMRRRAARKAGIR